ncbi:MAG: hypothetical protein ILO34_06285 [Kiritimatiellae bacterium]|nr:hypothetical protein [Kiritimatiellia bacterium]
MKNNIGFAVALAVFAAVQAFAGETAGNINSIVEIVPGYASVSVDPSAEIGPVKPMNGVNDAEPPGSQMGDQKRGNWRAFSALKVPFIRTHDAASMFEAGSAHVGDITSMFPDFGADENDPSNYDFALTDWLFGHWRTSGAKIFFRLGQTIEHWPKKYGTLRPSDYGKWARICEHVIRHYNEGWADGFEWGIEYWEIWNEPDLDEDDSKNKRCWGGTKAEFFDFYRVAAGHLKAAFPALKIGGPAVAYREDWGRDFIGFCRDNSVPLDFFSWHGYVTGPDQLANRGAFYRRVLDEAGFAETESICNEWNFVTDWAAGFQRSVGEIHGMKGAALVMSTMINCQAAPIDKLMYYDMRSDSAFNGAFDPLKATPCKPYWAFYAWRRLAECGTRIATATSGDDAGICAAAAKGPDGKIRIIVSRFTPDDNFFYSHEVVLSVAGRRFADGTAKLVDDGYSYGEAEFPVRDGALVLELKPNSFAVVELD